VIKPLRLCGFASEFPRKGAKAQRLNRSTVEW
jgi:hypothetical protein